MTENNISIIPNATDREFYRVDGQLFLHVELHSGENDNDSQGYFMPSFSFDEDDYVGLSIDAFRERLIYEDPPGKDYLLEIQQLLSMMKRHFDAELLGKKQNIYQKIAINISGSGLSFVHPSSYSKGQVLRLAMFFPRFPFNFVSVLGDVVKSDSDKSGYETKVHFREMQESTQDQILKFVNQCQRDSLQSQEDPE